MQQARGLIDEAERRGRDVTPAERGEVEGLLEQALAQKNIETMSSQLGSPGNVRGDGSFLDPSSWGGGPGDVFVQSAGYKQISSPDSRPQQWSSGPVEVMSSGPGYELKGTLLETTAGGPGGGLIPPFYQPGINSKLLEPLGVAAVFGQSQTTGSQVRYVNEGTALSGAAGVAEAGTKPESTLNYAEIVEPVKKVATLLPISDEMLEDAPSVQSYLNQRLSLFVRIEEERQLLRGNGTNELIGLFNRAGAQAINQYTRLTNDDNATALAKVIANTAGSAFLQPDAILMHPSNWLSTRLLRDGAGGTVGNFYGAGPFGRSGNNAGAANLFGGVLWDLPVVLSNVVGPGTALVGNFGQGCHIWRRGGVSVEASSSHQDYFAKNLTAIRSEARLALGLYRPQAVTEVRGLT